MRAIETMVMHLRLTGCASAQSMEEASSGKRRNGSIAVTIQRLMCTGTRVPGREHLPVGSQDMSCTKNAPLLQSRDFSSLK